MSQYSIIIVLVLGTEMTSPDSTNKQTEILCLYCMTRAFGFVWVFFFFFAHFILKV